MAWRSQRLGGHGGKKRTSLPTRLAAAGTNRIVCPYGDRLPLNGAKRQGVVASQLLTAASLGETTAEPRARRSWPPQAAERRKETTGVRGAAVKRPAFRHGMPFPYGSKNELPTSRQTAGLVTAWKASGLAVTAARGGGEHDGRRSRERPPSPGLRDMMWAQGCGPRKGTGSALEWIYSQPGGSRRRHHAGGVFPVRGGAGFSSRPALSRRFGVDSRLPVNSRTEPWALAGGRSADDRRCVRFSPGARALTGTALSGSRARPFSYAPAGLTRLWPLAPRVSLRFTLGYDPAAASRLKR